MDNNIRKKLIAMGLSGAIALGGALLAPFEGKVNKVYVDPVGILTSCYGHTGPELKKGQQFTDDQCLDQLAKDLLEHNKILTNVVKVELTPYEHAAFLSFLYNVGPGKKGVKDGFVTLKNGNQSTMLRKLNAGDKVGACNELLKWTKAGGVVLKGLVKRRTEERNVCLGNLN
ncbi:endolysin [Pseudomonas phage Paride]|nr:endolysin [Pseudomonas phage Deifobo]WPK40715.1 endolysin [Pseudomonas phage Paride]